MDAAFWLERWRERKTPFHQGVPNGYLTTFYERLNLPVGGTIFVPLCGKATDMLWLQEQGVSVIGVELSDVAIRDFFGEHKIEYVKSNEGAFVAFTGRDIRLLCGDYFDLTPSDLSKVDAVYDRAALIALPEQMRERYVRHLLQLFSCPVPILLLTVEYVQTTMNGPPFSVNRKEVHARFADVYDIQHMQTKDILDEEPRFRERGLTWLKEHAFLLTPNG